MDEKYIKLYEEVETGEVKRIPDFKDKNIQVFYNGLRRASNILEKKSPETFNLDKFIFPRLSQYVHKKLSEDICGLANKIAPPVFIFSLMYSYVMLKLLVELLK